MSAFRTSIFRIQDHKCISYTIHTITHAVDTLTHTMHAFTHAVGHPHIRTMHTHIHPHILTYTLTHPNHPHILTHPHTSSHTPSHILTTLTFSHTTHLTYILTHNHIYPHTPTHPHTPPHTTHTDWWSSIERGRSTGDHSWPPPPRWSVVFLSVSLCLCHSVCLSLCLSVSLSVWNSFGPSFIWWWVVVSRLMLQGCGRDYVCSCHFPAEHTLLRMAHRCMNDGPGCLQGENGAFYWAFGGCSNRLLLLPFPLLWRVNSVNITEIIPVNRDRSTMTFGYRHFEFGYRNLKFGYRHFKFGCAKSKFGIHRAISNLDTDISNSGIEIWNLGIDISNSDVQSPNLGIHI